MTKEEITPVTDTQIEEAIIKAKSIYGAKIVRHYDCFIILAQSENDYNEKISKIQHGDTKGFYTVQDILCIAKK
jgi:hypothetical protein